MLLRRAARAAAAGSVCRPTPSASAPSPKTSKHFGVGWNPKSQKWYAFLRWNGKMEYFGWSFDDEVVAAKAVDKRLRELGKLKNINYNDAGKFVYVAPKKSSQFKGVNRNKTKERWQVHISLRGKRWNLGYFEDEAEAARAYAVAAVRR